MEQKQITRKEYIESELNKWKDYYNIGFGQEFEIKALLDLQYQFMVTPKDHVKTIGDIIHTINQIKKNLNLKPKYSNSCNSEVWYIFINYSENKKDDFELKIVKTDKRERKIEISDNMNVNKFFNSYSISHVIFKKIIEEKPSKLIIPLDHIGKLIYESLIDLMTKNKEVMLVNNNDLIYLK